MVKAGSTAAKDMTSSASAGTRALRRSLASREIIVPDGDCLRFSEDRFFRSPSAAASVVIGGSQNGRLVWKNAVGKSLNDLELELFG